MITTIRKDVDKNGNSIVKVDTDKGGFSIQTNGNLPSLHKKEIVDRRKAKPSEKRAIECWVQNYGTERQRRIVDSGAKRYEELNEDDPDYEEKMQEQLDEFEKDAQDGKTVCLSDLMGNAGL